MSSMANVIYYKCLLTSTYLSIDASVFFMLLGALLIRDDALVGTTWSLVLDIILGFIVMSSFAVALVLFGDILINKRAVDAPNSTTFLSSGKDDEEEEEDDLDCSVYDNDDAIKVGSIDEIVRRELAASKDAMLLHMNNPDVAFSERKGNGENPFIAGLSTSKNAMPMRGHDPFFGEGKDSDLYPYHSQYSPYNTNTAPIPTIAHRQGDDPYLHGMAPHLIGSHSVSPSGGYHSRYYPTDLRPVSMGHPRVTLDDDDEMMSASGVEAFAIWNTLDDAPSSAMSRMKTAFSATRESPSGSNPTSRSNSSARGNPRAGTNRPSADRNKSQQPRGGKSRTQPGTPSSPVNNGSTINFPWTMLSRTQPNTPLHQEVDSTIPTVAVHTPADYLRSSVVRPHPKVVVDDDDDMMSPSGVEALAIWDTLDDANISNRSASDAPLGGAKSTTAFSATRGSPSGSNPTAGTSRPSGDRNKLQQTRDGQSRTQPGAPTSPSPINFPWINRLSSTQPNSPNVNGKPTASTLLVGSIGNSSNKVYASNDVMMSRSQDFLSGLLRHQPHSSGSPFDLESKGEVSELDGIDEEYDAVAAADLDINNNSNSKSNSNSNEVFRYDEEQNDMMSVNSVEEELSEKPPEKIKTILSENDLLVLLDKMKKEI